MLELIFLLVGFFVAWNVGANVAANCVGIPVGGRILSYRQAIAIVVAFALLGAFLEGWKNMFTVGKGIVLSGTGGENPLSAVPLVAIGALLATGAWVFFATVLGLPVSASQSMVSAVIGGGLLLSIIRPELHASVQVGMMGAIGIAWIFTPAISAIVAFVLVKVMSASMRRVKNIVLANQIFAVLVIVALAYSAYTLGANDVGASTGPVYAFFGGSPQVISLFGWLALAIGTVTFSRRVMYTVGSGITMLTPVTAFAAQFGAALTVWSFVQFGIPVSTAQSIVGAVAGAGLMKGASALSRRKLTVIASAWIATPFIAFLLSMAVGWVLLNL